MVGSQVLREFWPKVPSELFPDLAELGSLFVLRETHVEYEKVQEAASLESEDEPAAGGGMANDAWP